MASNTIDIEKVRQRLVAYLEEIYPEKVAKALVGAYLDDCGHMIDGVFLKGISVTEDVQFVHNRQLGATLGEFLKFPESGSVLIKLLDFAVNSIFKQEAEATIGLQKGFVDQRIQALTEQLRENRRADLN